MSKRKALRPTYKMSRLFSLILKVLLSSIAVLLLFTSQHTVVLAESITIGVVYPAIREPYRSVFESVIVGIEQQASADIKSSRKVQRLTLDESVDPQYLKKWLTENEIDSVIALGRRSHLLTRSLSLTIPVTTGAVLMSPDLDNNIDNGIVLNPNPKVVFTQLQLLSPKLQRITVIFNPAKNAWLIKRAKQAAKDLKIRFDSYPVSTLHQAAKVYRDVLKQQSGTRDAIWLLNDNSVFDNTAIFPLVLQEAWNRQFLVFSNNPAHVKRGVLFAMFPDNVKMGNSLAKLVLQQTKTKGIKNQTMQPLADLLIAFNMRTAEHLRLDVSRQQRNKFDLVFPPQ